MFSQLLHIYMYIQMFTYFDINYSLATKNIVLGECRTYTFFMNRKLKSK